MTVNSQDTQTQEASKPSDKELNFRKQEEMFKRQLDQERAAKAQLEEKLAQLTQERFAKMSDPNEDDDDSSDEPYVDHKRLKREQGKMVKQIVTETDTRIQTAVQRALAEERQSQWMKNNPDFYDVMQHAQTFADRDPELAETILAMPEGFDRQKLVYKNIKALGIHKKEEPKASIQEKIDQNRRSPFYQPSGVASAPYAAAGDFSESGQKNSYDKMKELQKRLRI